MDGMRTGCRLLCDWRHHRGIANAPAHQAEISEVEISACGCFPGDPGFEQVHPSPGFRWGVIGNVK